jgi:GNAT superfamily N-acetyltransferase
MEIRQLTEKDMDQAIRLKLDCWKEELAGKLDIPLNFERELSMWTNWMLTAEQINDLRCLIGVFNQHKLIGVAFASFIESIHAPEEGIELNGLWVDQNHRGKHISYQLIQSILETYQPYGVKKLIVYCMAYAPANQYYLKLGGKKIAREYQFNEQLPVDIFEFDMDHLHLYITNAF